MAKEMYDIIILISLMLAIFLFGYRYNFLKQDQISKRIRMICLIFSAPLWLPIDFFVVLFVAIIKGHNPIKRWLVHNKYNLTLIEGIKQYIDGVL